MKRQRTEKHESLIHRVMNEFLIKEGRSFLKNEFVTVMGIKLSPDLSIALIFISPLDNSKCDFIEEKLLGKKHEIKQYIVKSIGKKMRKMPEIKFIIDSTEHEASKINKILSNLNIPPKD